MKTLYLELNMGASGDMLMSALYELIEDKEAFLKQMNALGYDKVKVTANDSMKCGISGTNISVLVDGEEEESLDVDLRERHHHHDDEEGEHDHCCHHHDDEEGGHEHCCHHHDEESEHDHCHHHHDEEGGHDHCHHHHDEEGGHDHCHHHHHHEGHHHHHHSGLKDVVEIISSMEIEEKVKEDAIEIYKLIGEAESRAHNMPMEEVHFHEVGTIDAVYDIVGVCILMDCLHPDEIIASPINLGSGMVKCQHGIMPVPAPATAHLVKEIPAYTSSVRGELCTPTGAAILKHFVDRYESMPIMTTEKIGYGMGKKNFDAPNCVRAFLGESKENEGVVELVSTIDDMTGEEIGYVYEHLFSEGALEVYTTNIHMKKNRPGIELTVICKKKDREKMIGEIFKHTTTLGVKEYQIKREKMDRKVETVESKFGTIRKKVSTGHGIKKEKYEYEDLKKIADETGLSLAEIKKEL